MVTISAVANMSFPEIQALSRDELPGILDYSSLHELDTEEKNFFMHIIKSFKEKPPLHQKVSEYVRNSIAENRKSLEETPNWIQTTLSFFGACFLMHGFNLMVFGPYLGEPVTFESIQNGLEFLGDKIF